MRNRAPRLVGNGREYHSAEHRWDRVKVVVALEVVFFFVVIEEEEETDPGRASQRRKEE